MYKNYGYLYTYCLPYFSGSYSNGVNAGAFYIDVVFSDAYYCGGLGGRLMFL